MLLHQKTEAKSLSNFVCQVKGLRSHSRGYWQFINHKGANASSEFEVYCCIYVDIEKPIKKVCNTPSKR